MRISFPRLFPSVVSCPLLVGSIFLRHSPGNLSCLVWARTWTTWTELEWRSGRRIGSMHLGALRGELSRINFKVLPGKPAQIFIVCPGIATIVGGSPSNTFQSAYEISGHANYSHRRTWDIQPYVKWVHSFPYPFYKDSCFGLLWLNRYSYHIIALWSKLT